MRLRNVAEKMNARTEGRGDGAEDSGGFPSFGAGNNYVKVFVFGREARESGEKGLKIFARRQGANAEKKAGRKIKFLRFCGAEIGGWRSDEDWFFERWEKGG